MTVEEQILLALKRRRITQKQLHALLKEKYNKKDTVQNLSNKIKRNSLKYEEAREIANVLNYDIVWQDNNKEE